MLILRAAFAPGTTKDPQAPGGCMVVNGPSKGPVMPLGVKTVTMHIMVDHEIVETIVNNRSGIVLLHPLATLVGVSVVQERGCQHFHITVVNNRR